jgi:hypothetical protein
MTSANNVSQGLVVTILAAAERGGVSIGGLFLLVIGLYGGQYAQLFPENLRDIAGWFCLIVSGSGLAAIIVQLLKSFSKSHDEAKPVSAPPPTTPV